MTFSKKAPRIIISRTDSIGDVVLTLPMAGVLKEQFPGCEIIFIGTAYTKAVIALSKYVDTFIDYGLISVGGMSEMRRQLSAFHADVILHVLPKSDIAMAAALANIPVRIGTRNRLFHWWTCNKLIKLSRRNSDLHEAQLNLMLLAGIFKPKEFAPDQIPGYYGFSKVPDLKDEFRKLLDPLKKNIILHPSSKGSASEWGIENYSALIKLLRASDCSLFVTGVAADREKNKVLLETGVTDLCGKMELDQLIAFISACNGLVAASTGPLHIAAALGKNAIGLFSSRRPIHPGRWKPLGKNAHALVADPDCPVCKVEKECNCIRRIKPETVAALL
jgi:heptosyltransferase-3